MVFTSRTSLLFFALTSLQVALSARFKIAIPVDEGESVHTHLAKRAGNACADYELVNDTANLLFPVGFQHLPKPWDKNDTTVATSPTVTAGIRRLLDKKVPGLNGVTIEEVIDEIQQRGCLSFPFGGSVRDQFLGASPADLDMETNCAPETIRDICTTVWGTSHCSNVSTNMIVHIGDREAIYIDENTTDVIDASNWNETFFGSGIALEYTTNSMAYFGDGLNIIIDITGHGIKDTCNKNIHIPVGVDKREMWVNQSTGKVYRFWKLRIKEYTAIDADTMSFIVSEAKGLISADSTGFKNFYCSNALNGSWNKSDARPTCTIPEGFCVKALENKKKYDAAFAVDLGDFWDKTAREFIEDLECASCPDAETCNESVSTTSSTGSVSTTSSTGSVPTTSSIGSVSTTSSIAVLWGIIATVYFSQ